MPKARLANPRAGAIRWNQRCTGARESVSPKPAEKGRHRDRGEEGEDPERDHGDRVAVDRGEEEDADPGRAADPVYEPDAVRLERRPRPCRPVRMGLPAVYVTVGVDAAVVRMQVDVEDALASI